MSEVYPAVSSIFEGEKRLIDVIPICVSVKFNATYTTCPFNFSLNIALADKLRQYTALISAVDR